MMNIIIRRNKKELMDVSSLLPATNSTTADNFSSSIFIPRFFDFLAKDPVIKHSYMLSKRNDNPAEHWQLLKLKKKDNLIP